MTNEIDIRERYEFELTGANDLLVANDLVITRALSTWHQFNDSQQFSNALFGHNDALVLDTGAITEALNSQFHPQNTRFAEVPFVPDEFLDMFYAANREIHILREVEQELFNALVVNADPVVGQQRLDAYLEWRNDGIERGLVHIVEGDGANYQVISQPNTEWNYRDSNRNYGVLITNAYLIISYNLLFLTLPNIFVKVSQN